MLYTGERMKTSICFCIFTLTVPLLLKRTVPLLLIF